MQEEINNFCENYGYHHTIIPPESLNKIYNLLTRNIPFNPTTAIEYNYSGVYYQVKQQHEQAKEYYLMAIQKGDSNAMYNLAFFHNYIEEDRKKMKKYYLMAIEKNNINAMFDLGYDYEYRLTNSDNDPKFGKMEKYYLMAIENGSISAMDKLSGYYKMKSSIDLLELRIKYQHMTTYFAIVKLINKIIKYGTYKGKEDRFIKGIIKYMKLRNLPFNIEVLLIAVKNSMIQ